MSDRLLLSERVRRRLSEIAEMLEEIEEIETEIARLRAEVARLRMTDAEPIAWQVTDAYGPIGAAQWMDGEARWPKNQSVPLYLTPQPTLTDAEREAVEWAKRFACNGQRLAALSGLLARLGGDA